MIVRHLDVDLTPDEVRHKGEQLAARLRDLEQLELALKDYKDKHKTRVGELESVTRLLASEVRSRKETRPVECHEVKDYERGVVDLVRVDTGEVVETRGMDPGERQTRLFSTTTGKAKEPKAPAA